CGYDPKFGWIITGTAPVPSIKDDVARQLGQSQQAAPEPIAPPKPPSLSSVAVSYPAENRWIAGRPFTVIVDIPDGVTVTKLEPPKRNKFSLEVGGFSTPIDFTLMQGDCKTWSDSHSTPYSEKPHPRDAKNPFYDARWYSTFYGGGKDSTAIGVCLDAPPGALIGYWSFPFDDYKRAPMST